MGIYKKLFRYAPEKTGLALLSMAVAAVSSVLTALAYYYLWRFFGVLFSGGDYAAAGRMALYIVTALMLKTLCYFAAGMLSHLAAFRLETNLRKRGLHGLLRASFGFFDVHSSGKIRKLIDNNAVDTHMAVAHLIPDTVVAVLTPLLLLITMFTVDTGLGIFLLVMTIFGGWMMKAMMGEMSFMKQYQEALEKMNAEAVEYVRGMPVLKVFRVAVRSFKALYEAITSYSELAYKYTLSCRVSYVVFQVVLILSSAFPVVLAAARMAAGAPFAVEAPKIAFYAAYSGALFTGFMAVMYVGMYHYQAGAAVDKLENLLDETHRCAVSHGTETVFANNDIEFKGVTFRYDETDVLKDLSFTLPGGKVYALVGSSGGGKSTIAKLISGFYSVAEGDILIGGKSITAYTQEALMKKISFVFQNARLFKTSIYENVRMARPDATREEVMQALDAAVCTEILDKFPERENTVIGAKGVYLSGGETQRIAVARAILKNADIVILDEASAAADPENEYQMYRAFDNLMRGKTVIMIAHRIHSIRNADEILVVDEGRVVERGNDKELSALNGRYKRLADLYDMANDWRIYDCEA